jgi:hypothetical protein
MREKEFNNVKSWLLKKLGDRQISTNMLATIIGLGITNATLFRWYNGTHRPNRKKMEIVCTALSSIPIRKEGEPIRYEEVLPEDGMAQFSKRARSTRKHLE